MTARRLRIAQVAPPLEPVPPPAYGGTERIVAELVRELHDRGHEVTTFASADSHVPGRLVPTVRQALWASGFTGDFAPWMLATVQQVLEQASEFDLIHAHLEWYGPLLAHASPVPVVLTFHGRLDVPWADGLLLRTAGHRVAISGSQAAMQPDARWAAVIHNGLRLHDAPFAERPGDDLLFVGRIAPEKGVADAIEIARLSGRRLRIAAKSGKIPSERDYYSAVFEPALRRAGSLVEWLGEVPSHDRDRLYAESHATLMPGAWPEPFGLVAIESLACGTPVVARRVGALPEILRPGIDGFFGDDVEQLAFLVGRAGELDRAAIRASVTERFSAGRMTDAYEALYRRVVEPSAGSGSGEPLAKGGRPAVPVMTGYRFETPSGMERGWLPDLAGVSRARPSGRRGEGTATSADDDPPAAHRGASSGARRPG